MMQYYFKKRTAHQKTKINGKRNGKPMPFSPPLAATNAE